MNNIVAPMNSVLIGIEVAVGEQVSDGQVLATVEAMKMQYAIKATSAAKVSAIAASIGDVLQEGELICQIEPITGIVDEASKAASPREERQDLRHLEMRLAATLDTQRGAARDKRHAKGFRTARENLNDLVDEGSFIEYGQLCVAAQRNRRPLEELQTETAADGIITGTATINADAQEHAEAAIVINDYSVLAGTQGYFHHHKLDRILELAERSQLPVVMYTEGGGGRPGDTDVQVSMAGLNVGSFKAWAKLSGLVPRIAVNNGYCFAGNAALFGCADITIATKASYIGMAGPAMIEGGGLGKFAAQDIGPIDVQSNNGVVDLVAEDEADATRLAKQCLGYFQGVTGAWKSVNQNALRELIPEERRGAYQVRDVIDVVFDTDSFLELRPNYGRGMVTGFARLEGKAIAVVANDCHYQGGAVDSIAAAKAARFIQLCDAFAIPLVSLTDTPGFMVGPESETQAAVRNMASLFVTAASITTPVVAIVLRKGYGLGAMAMTAGSMFAPVFTAAWPSGEFGPMGLEGAVSLGFKKELEAAAEGEERDALFAQLLAKMIEQGRATEAASYQEIDAVIDPADTRACIIKALSSAKPSTTDQRKRRNFVDTR